MAVPIMSVDRLLVEVVVQAQSMVSDPSEIQMDRSLGKLKRQRRMSSLMTSLVGDEEMGYMLTKKC